MFTTGSTEKGEESAREKRTIPSSREFLNGCHDPSAASQQKRWLSGRDDNFGVGLELVELKVNPHLEKPRARHSRDRSCKHKGWRYIEET